MTEAILFDAGNTLVLFDCDYVAQTLSEAGGSVSAAAIRQAEYQARFAIDSLLLARMECKEELPRGTASMHHTDLWRLYFAKLLASVEVAEDRQPAIIDALIARERASPLGLWRKLAPGLRLVLSELRHRGYTLAVVSNSDGRLKEKFRELKIDGFFDLIIDSDEVGIEKPDPRLFQLALRACNVGTSSAALYIGDLYSVDVLAARRAGLQALLYDPAGLYGNYEATVVRLWSDLLNLLPTGARTHKPCAVGVEKAGAENVLR
jgi:putative hydrolase of the HAD superfamily